MPSSRYDPAMEPRVVGPGWHERVFAVVATVPPGRVTTYGDVAGALGSRRVARQVGFALAALPADRDDVPWHRVVSGRGLLRAEGVEIDTEGRIVDFANQRFSPISPSPNANSDDVP